MTEAINGIRDPDHGQMIDLTEEAERTQQPLSSTGAKA
jgi:hypothetical protein